MTCSQNDRLSELAAAIHSDNVPEVRKILRDHPELKPDLNDAIPDGSFGATALLVAVNHNNREMIDALLDAGADPNARSHWWAGSFGVLDGCKAELAPHLIARGAKVDAHSAARLGMFDRLKELVAADPTVVHSRGGDGQTPLHFASTVEIAEFLLDCGADIDARCVDHESTPAQWMLRDRQEVARFLVSRGCHTDILMAAALGDLELVKKHFAADPASIRLCVRDEFFPRKNPRAASIIYLWTLGAGKTPHRVARDFGHQAVVDFLMKQSPTELKFITACYMGDAAAVRQLLAQNPDASKDLTAEDKWHLPGAARDNDLKAVSLMLECGFPVNTRGPHGGTALHWASWHGNAPLVREILKHKPDIENTENDFHATPLAWALHGSQNSWHRTMGDYPATVQALLSAGATLPAQAPNRTLDKDILTVIESFKRNSTA